ncbi:MAG: hypothetical protein GY754_14910 [bacterium]|nr:hypothetical protein [bacterium]
MKFPTKILTALFILGFATILLAAALVEPLKPREIGLGVVHLKAGQLIRSAAPPDLDYERPLFFRSASMSEPFSSYCKPGYRKYTFKTKRALNLVVKPGFYDTVIGKNEFVAHPDNNSAESKQFIWRWAAGSAKLANVAPKAILVNYPFSGFILEKKAKLDDGKVRVLLRTEAEAILADVKKQCDDKNSEVSRKYRFLCGARGDFTKLNPVSYAAPLIFGVDGIDGWVSTDFPDIVLFGRPDGLDKYSQKSWENLVTLVSSPPCPDQ